VAPAWARDGLVEAKRCADGHGDPIAQAALAAFVRDGHLARHVRRMQPVYAARRAVLLDGLRNELADWFEPIPSEAGLHLAARVRDARRAPRILALARQHLPGTQAIAAFALAPSVPPALAIGYGVIDAWDIPRALGNLRAALAR
jgi:GntR family transcriptional regulator/MocR family aminotransferase